MSEQPLKFRNFGIHPAMLKPPPERVRCFISPLRSFGQHLGTVIVSLLGLSLAVFVGMKLPMPLNLLASVSALTAFGIFVYYATHTDYQWVELDGQTIRAKHFYTRKTIERSIPEVDSLTTMVYRGRPPLETAIVEKLLGRVRGVEVCFRDRRTPLRIQRADPAMTNAQELIEGLIFRMTEIREVDAELIDYAGLPLVRRIYWKGETPVAQSGENLKVILVCLMGLALMFGTIVAFIGSSEQERYHWSSFPPRTMTLDALIHNGPGTNRHITLTDFQPGGYATESRGGSWAEVWIALFPIVENDRGDVVRVGGNQIEVVLTSRRVRDDGDLESMLSDGRVTVICSATPRSDWGRTLGPNLVEMNPSYELSSAWSVEEMTEPPTFARVAATLAGAVACLAAVPILAVFILWKAS